MTHLSSDSGKQQTLGFRFHDEFVYSLQVCSCGLIYWGLSRLGWFIEFDHGPISPLWLPSGFSFAFLLLAGLRYWPAITLGAFLVNIIRTNDWGSAILMATGNTLEAVVGCWVLRSLGFRRELDRIREVFLLIVVGCLFSSAISAGIGTTTLFEMGQLSSEEWEDTLAIWWVGDGLSILLVTPILLIWSRPVGWSWNTQNILECVGCFAGLIVATLILFREISFTTPFVFPSFIIAFPFLIWSAARFGQHGNAISVLLFSTIAIFVTIHGRGPFHQPNLLESLFALDFYLLLCVSTLYFVGAAISHQKWIERDLKKERELLCQAEEIANLGSWETDQSGQRSRMSEHAYRILGIRPDQFDGQLETFINTWIHPEDRTKFRRRWETAGPNATQWNLEYRIVRPNGSIRLLLAHGRKRFDQQGNWIGSFGTVQDITELRQADEVRDRLSTILETTSDLVAITHVVGPTIYINPAGRRLLGLNDTEQVYLSDHRSPAHKQLVLEEAIPTAVREGMWRGETYYLSRSGEEIPVSQVIIAHKSSEEKVIYISTIARDLREQKRLEEQFRHAQKMEAIGRLAGGIAHDFNNLLTVINGYSDLLLQNMPVEDINRSFVGDIAQAGNRAATLTRQLLAFSRKQMMTLSVVNLNEVVQGIEKMLARLIGEDIHLVTDLTRNLGNIKADAGQLEQILMNLAVNARDAMPNGGELRIRTEPIQLSHRIPGSEFRVEPGNYVALHVRDTGCGMDQNVQKHLFEPFFTTKTIGKGTGLGLATVYGIVKQSDGYITVESEVGCGTTFHIYFPQITEEASDSTEPLPRQQTSGSETILLVEDDQGVREIAQKILERLGYCVCTAQDGIEALELTQQHGINFDLLVTDVVMPRMNGRELADRFWTIDPQMKVLFLSGYTDDRVLRNGIQECEVQFLQKPFTPEGLTIKIREILDSPTPSRNGRIQQSITIPRK